MLWIALAPLLLLTLAVGLLPGRRTGRRGRAAARRRLGMGLSVLLCAAAIGAAMPEAAQAGPTATGSATPAATPALSLTRPAPAPGGTLGAAVMGAATPGQPHALSLGGSLLGVLNGVLGATGLPGTTAPNLSAVFNTPNLGNLLAGAGCPIAKSLPSPPVPNQISQVICALGELNYAYRTVYVEPNGTTLTRITRALLGVPTPINVDGSGLPDFVGTVSPSLSGGQLGLILDISRVGLLPAGARVSVEAIALDPAAPGTYVGAGEDGLAAGTDSDWSATLTLVSDSTAGTEIQLTQKNAGAPSSVGVLGELFSGSNPDAPTDVSRGDISFTPVPSTLTTDVKLGQSSQEASVTSSAPTKVGANVSLISSGDDKEITATVNKLNKSLDLAYTHPNGDTKVNYSSDATVGALSAGYHDTVNGVLTNAAALDASGVPTGLSVDQAGAQTAVTTSGGAIGLVEARYGSGRDAPTSAPGTGAYAAYHAYTDGSSTAGVRLPNLQALTLNAAEPFAGDLILTTALGYVALSAQDDTQGYVVSGHLSNLPKHSTVGINLSSGGGGIVTFDGHGTGIDEIAVDATNTKGTFFSRASRIDADISQIPALDTITFADGSSDPQTTQSTASATAPIGSISLLASDGSDAPAVTGSGVWYTDTQPSFNAFARLEGLSGFNVSLTSDGDSLKALSGSIQTASQDPGCQGSGGQDLTLNAQTDSGTFDGTIDALPSSVGFSMAPDASGNTIFDYQASAPIKKITADATGFAAIAALGVGGDIAPAMDRFHAEVDCLPAHMTMDMDTSGETNLNTYGDHIGEVIAQVYNHQVGPATPADVSYADSTNSIVPAPIGDQLAYYDPATKGISIDLKSVGGFDFLDDSTTSVLKLQYDLESSTPLAFDYISQSLTSPLGLSGTVEKPQPGTLTVDTNTDGTMTMQFAANSQSSNLTGDGGLGTVNFDGFVKSNYLQGALGNVPANLSICLDYSTGVEDCGPPWVYQDALGDPLIDNPPQLFAVHVVPTDLNGNVIRTPLTLSGEFCFGSALKSDCDKTGANQGGGPAGLFIPAGQPLAFDTLWVGFGQHTDDCHLSFTCGRAWAGLDTTNEGTDPGGKLTGKAEYYQNGANDVTITFDTNGAGYVETNQLYVYADYNIGADFGFEELSQGSISCGASGHQGLLLNEGPGIDLFTNSVLGLCP
jgi:hypothetical protein